MANLLPVAEKKKIRKEYRIRLGIVAMFLFAGLVVVAIVLLTPSYILSSFKYSSAFSQLEIEKKKISDAAAGLDPIKEAKDINAKLIVLEREGSLMPLSYDIFTTIVGHKPQNVKINAIFYDRENMDGRISINGLSKDRETLLSFLKSLEGENMFDRVELPISSFVEGEDIEFSIRISIERANNTSKENEEE